MRAFIVLCLVAVACADKLGYNYRPVDHSSAGLSFAPGSGNGGLDFGGSSAGPSYGGENYGGGSSSAPGSSFAPQGDNYGAGSSSAPGSSFAPQGDNYGAGSNSAPSYAPQGGEVDKEFYSFTANDDDFVEPAASNQYANGGKQGLRVIFIKGPENNGLENAALNLAKQAAEQKTAIYVLNKQPDIGGLADKFNNAYNNVNHKPEVHFVKYRTPEDAANAQRAIQGQYDQLGGRSQNFHGGVAPVLNFASQAPAGRGSYGGGPSSSNAYLAPFAGGNANPSYLPSSVFRRRFRLK